MVEHRRHIALVLGVAQRPGAQRRAAMSAEIDSDEPKAGAQFGRDRIQFHQVAEPAMQQQQVRSVRVAGKLVVDLRDVDPQSAAARVREHA